MGGFHLAKPGGASADEAVALVHAGIAAGITFFDCSWDYNGGESEKRLGRALAGGYRDRVFLMSKMDGRTAKSFEDQLNESLSRLQTRSPGPGAVPRDHPHGRPGRRVHRRRHRGGSEGARGGKVRYIGFTGHKSPAIHKHMFEVADRHGFHFDTVQMPLNVMDAHFDSFEQGVLPVALDHGTAVLGMKTFGDDFILKSGACPPMEMLHYAMALPTALQVCGIDHQPILEQALEAVRTYRPMTPEARASILDKTAKAASGRQDRALQDHRALRQHHPEPALARHRQVLNGRVTRPRAGARGAPGRRRAIPPPG